METFWQIAVAGSGLGAVGALVFFSLYNKWLSLPIFPRLTRNQAFKLFLVFLIFTFLGLIALLAAYLHVQSVALRTDANIRELAQMTHQFEVERARADRLVELLTRNADDLHAVATYLKELNTRLSSMTWLAQQSETQLDALDKAPGILDGRVYDAAIANREALDKSEETGRRVEPLAVAVPDLGDLLRDFSSARTRAQRRSYEIIGTRGPASHAARVPVGG